MTDEQRAVLDAARALKRVSRLQGGGTLYIADPQIIDDFRFAVRALEESEGNKPSAVPELFERQSVREVLGAIPPIKGSPFVSTVDQPLGRSAKCGPDPPDEECHRVIMQAFADGMHRVQQSLRGGFRRLRKAEFKYHEPGKVVCTSDEGEGEIAEGAARDALVEAVGGYADEIWEDIYEVLIANNKAFFAVVVGKIVDALPAYRRALGGEKETRVPCIACGEPLFNVNDHAQGCPDDMVCRPARRAARDDLD